jgi:prophage regulatory protein
VVHKKKILRLSDVMALTGLAKSTVYSWGANGKFPRPFKIAGSIASAWASSEVDAWIDATTRAGIAARDSDGRPSDGAT